MTSPARPAWQPHKGVLVVLELSSPARLDHMAFLERAETKASLENVEAQREPNLANAPAE